jgi:hypothetical protein
VGSFVAITIVNSIVYSPTKIAQQYVDDLSAGNLDDANKVAYPSFVPDNARQLITGNASDKKGPLQTAKDRITDVSLGEPDIQGDQASIRVDYKVGGNTLSDTLSLGIKSKNFLVFNNWELKNTLV